MVPGQIPQMKSQNFEFLRPKRAVLADLAGFAEQYAHSDPAGSLGKQRGFVELVVHAIYDAYHLPRPWSDNLNDLMNEGPFIQTVPQVVLGNLHAIRVAGNQALHPKKALPPGIALDRLRSLFQIAEWFHLRVDRGARSDCPTYQPPPPAPTSNGKAKEALEKLRLAEAKYESVLQALEAERKAKEEERQKRVQAEEQTAEQKAQYAALLAQGKQVADLLQFDEATTRNRLIDALLLDAGWDVGLGGKSTDQVGQEVPLYQVPSPSGDGYADYVLYGDDGKPLAVVEAKRTAKDANVGREQARVYAECLQKQTGQRPVIFFTNGVDIMLWDDAQGYTPRKVYGFYSKDSLEYLLHQRTNKKVIANVEPNLTIANRIYQLEAIKRVTERFAGKNRKALLVQATGTGKTRVAVSLADVLMRAGWVKRILFLCDRKELRRQADNVFKEFLPGAPRVVVSSKTATDRDKRIYLATYPAMDKCFEEFDVGFFDLIIADESHRSIYKKYRAIFRYFDALQVGLTATPRSEIEHQTYELFGCQNDDPTSYFGFQEAVNSKPPYLVPFRVLKVRTDFRERGIKYPNMTPEQKAQAAAQDDDPQSIDYDAEELDKWVFNKATSRLLWKSLMDDGIRDATGSYVGKTIVFCRSKKHADHLAKVFAEMYPHLGPSFCRVIVSGEAYVENLIDNFKSNDSTRTDPIQVAISVDMLDTGIDVPEVVNLVFAKPIKSYVKFWQMIGRGTRLKKDLFGPGRDKSEFLIFDHWSNFWFFDEKYQEKEPPRQKALLQRVFETRVEVAALALDKMAEPDFQNTVDLLVDDIRDTRETGVIDVKDKWKELEALSKRERIAAFEAATKSDLLLIASPLMRWRKVRGEEEAYRFDLLVHRAEVELLRGGSGAARFLDLKAHIEAQVELLMKNQSPVKAKADAIAKVRSKDFWTGVTVAQLEEVRTELRGVMKYQQQGTTGSVGIRELDVEDADFVSEEYVPKLEGLDLVEYQRRVRAVIDEHFASNATLKRIREGKAVKDSDLDELARLVLQVDEKANIRQLVGRLPETRRSLLAVFRGLVGLDAKAVEAAFAGFVHKHPRLSAQQLRFLQLVQNHIAQNGGIEIERLYEAPFTTIHAESVDGVFPDSREVDELLAILTTFETKAATHSDPPPAKRAS
jgi:type I restriction enzyme R subunit